MKTVLIFILTLLTATVTAQQSLKAHRTGEAPKIDGNLTEAVWIAQLETKTFTQKAPNAGQPSLRATEIAVLYDDNYLYVGAVLHTNDTDEIRRLLTARDDVGNADYFGVQIDPFGQTREGYDFTVTAAGVQFDSKISGNTGADENFNVIWESEVTVYDTHWDIEIRIPWNSIRFPKEDLSDFTINFQRFSGALNEESFWSPIDPTIDGYLNQFGSLVGIEPVNPPLNLSFVPFVSAVHETDSDGATETTLNPGLDVKYVIDNAYTLDVSVIPDFSQARSDDQVFNLSPFEVQFAEQRPFFIEGTELFDKGGYLFTRRIGGRPINANAFTLSYNEMVVTNPTSSNIINLVKFTGKSQNGLSIGVLNGVTAFAKAEIKNTSTDEVREVITNPLTNYNALVIDKQLKNNSSVTLINNSVLRSGSAYDSNFSALLYEWFNAKRTYRASFKKAVSQQYGLDGDNVFGHEYNAYVSKVSGAWTGGVSWNLKDEDFDNNDFGFLQRNNSMVFRGNVNYRNTAPKKWFQQYQLDLDHQQRFYYSLMERERSQYRFSSFATTKGNQNLFVTLSYVSKRQDFFEARVQDRVFNRPALSEIVLEYQTNRNKNLSWAGYFVAVDYKNHNIQTEQYVMGYGLRARLGQHFFAEFEQDYTDNPNDIGYITNQEDQIIIGQRSINQLTNAIQLNYAVNAKINMNLRLRHYWIKVDYKNQYTLQQDGDLTVNNLSIDPDSFDSTFNAFNLDFVARWQFAPASELSLGYRVGKTAFADNVNGDYLDGIHTLSDATGLETLSLRMRWFLDFSRLKKRS